MKRNTEDKALLTKLRKYISSKDPETIQKRKMYANDPKVKKRRKELNQERRYMHCILTKMLDNGELYDKEGHELKLYNNRVIIPSLKKYIYLDGDYRIVTGGYKDEIELMMMPYCSPYGKHSDEQFKDLLQKFVEGDPEITAAVAKKRIITEEEDPNINNLREIIRGQLEKEEYSESE
jgi:hypothetical protein